MRGKGFSVIVILSILMVSTVLILYVTLKAIQARVLEDLPLNTKLLLNQIQKAKNSGSFIDSPLPIRCIKRKLNLTQLSIEVETDEKPGDLLLTRAKAAYEISTHPCLKLQQKLNDFHKSRNLTEIKNETLVDCIKNELKELKANSIVVDGFEGIPEEDVKDCQLQIGFLADKEKSEIENIFKESKIKKCSLDEFVQLDMLKVKIYEEFLAPTVNLSNVATYEKFTKEFAANVHQMADKQILCIYKEIY